MSLLPLIPNLKERRSIQMKGIIENYRYYFKFFLIILLFTVLSGCNGVTPSSPIINSFTVDSTIIDEGDSVTLSWTVTDATTVTINQGVGAVALSGSASVFPTETTTYTLTASNSAGSVTANVTVTVSTALQIAIDLVVNEILPDISEIELGKPYWCIKLDDPLPVGTLIEEDSGIPIKASVNIVLQEEMFFFYLDLAPGSYYAHPVKYILVDEEGNHEEYDANWWPKIAGQVPTSLVKDIPEQEDIIASNVELISPIGTVMAYVLPLIISQWSEGFIVVQGLMPTEANHSDATLTYSNGINFFNAYKNSFSTVEGLVQSDATQVLDTIDQMIEEGKSVITIYIIAHGDVDWVKLGGQWFSATQFKNKMAAYPSVTFNFILGSCHSGSFINDLSVLSNVGAVETACSSDEGAWPDYDEWGSADDVNPIDVGSEWTSSLIQAMDIITSDSDKMDTIREWAAEFSVPVTSMLICQAGYGALGYHTVLGLTTDYDFTHDLGWTSPTGYCSATPIEIP
jgi:hypothetical protein